MDQETWIFMWFAHKKCTKQPWVFKLEEFSGSLLSRMTCWQSL